MRNRQKRNGEVEERGDASQRHEHVQRKFHQSVILGNLEQSSRSGERRGPHNGEDVPILKAEGGAGGTGSGDYPMWLDGRGSICQVKELEGRKQNLSDFTDSIEMDENTDMVSRITDIQAGSGGAGGYGNITTDYNVTYTIRAGGTGTDVDVSNYVNKITCDDPSRCEDGTQSDTCAAQAGKNGAVVILW